MVQSWLFLDFVDMITMESLRAWVYILLPPFHTWVWWHTFGAFLI